MNQQDPSRVWIGWAGYLFQVPKTFRLARVDGDYLRGGLALADDQRVRIELNWTVAKGSFNLKAHAQKRLGPESKVYKDAGLNELFYVRAGDNTPARAAGFSHATRRVIEIDFHQSDQADETWNTLLRGLVDQPRTGAMKWAFFDCSFVSPAGFVYADAILNLGDMSVRLMTGGSEKAGSVLNIRQIYPASLALARQPIDAWLREWDKQASTRYLREGAGMWGRKPAVVRKYPTALGEGCSAQSKLRRGMSLLYWKMGKSCEAVMVEDMTLDRLIGVRVADQPQIIKSLLEEVLAGLNWAKAR